MIYYLAGAVDLVKDGGMDWRRQLRELCAGTNDITLYDPTGPFKFNRVSKRMSEYIYEVNTHALMQADVAVVRLMRGEASVGTPIEMFNAFRERKPVIIMTDMKESVYMTFFGSHPKAKVVGTLHELYGAILEAEQQAVADAARMAEARTQLCKSDRILGEG